MLRKFAALSLALVAGILAACGGRGSAPSGGMGGVSYALPPVEDLAITASLPKNSIGEDLPGVLGTIKSVHFGAKVGGFTQMRYSQTLAFPPGTKITIHNLSKDGTAHTFNVIMVVTGKTVHFPTNPGLLLSAHGHGKLEAGYRSGIIDAGKSVTVTLAKEGTYVVGCAFHYVSNGMRDIIVVKSGAKPGPQASPPSSTPSPQPTSTGSGGGW